MIHATGETLDWLLFDFSVIVFVYMLLQGMENYIQFIFTIIDDNHFT